MLTMASVAAGGGTPARDSAFAALGRDAAAIGLRLSDAQLDLCGRYATDLIDATRDAQEAMKRVRARGMISSVGCA